MWAWLHKTINKTFPTAFSRYIFYSALGHGVVFLILNFSITPFKIKAPEKPLATQVIWTRTVKSPKPKTPDKLPPPDVPVKKAPPKEEKVVNIEKKKPPKKEEKKDPKIDRQKQLQEALEKMKAKIEDDRPIPKDDNFDTSDQDTRDMFLSEAEVDAIKASPELIAYTEVIQSMIIDHFLWYQSDSQFITEIQIYILPDGNISETQLLKSSGNPSFDQATLRAVEKSSPLPQPTGKLVQLFQQEPIVFKFDGSQL